MPTFRIGTVSEIIGERPGLQRVRVTGVDEGDRAYSLTELTGPLAVGDQVVMNTTAVDLGLGTGGWHVVHWNLAQPSWDRRGPEHIMKLRYTSLQFDAGTDELAHPDLPTELGGAPVVACMVHSQVAAVAAQLKHLAPATRVAYVMTDGAALPLALSDLVADLRDRALIDVTVTAGHAFGGDLEAVGVPSALQLARHIGGADVVIAGIGPGVVGTGTPYGHTGIDAAWALVAAASLGGAPVLAVRASSGDPRPRHQGVSHHTKAVARLAPEGTWVAAVPAEASELEHVRTCPIDPPDTVGLLAELGLRVTTMGRLPEADRLFFDAAGAAGSVASRLWEGAP